MICVGPSPFKSLSLRCCIAAVDSEVAQFVARLAANLSPKVVLARGKLRFKFKLDLIGRLCELGNLNPPLSRPGAQAST
jgi:hypothetical protein